MKIGSRLLDLRTLRLHRQEHGYTEARFHFYRVAVSAIIDYVNYVNEVNDLEPYPFDVTVVANGDIELHTVNGTRNDYEVYNIDYETSNFRKKRPSLYAMEDYLLEEVGRLLDKRYEYIANSRHLNDLAFEVDIELMDCEFLSVSIGVS